MARWKKRLEESRAAVLAEGPKKIEPNRSDAVTVGVPDEDAQALSEMNQTLASQWNRRQAETLAQIDRALRKLTESPDEFGLCEECEEEIPHRRLDFLPQAQLCTECQDKRDPRRGGTRRSLTDFR